MTTPYIPIWARDLPLLLAEVYAKMKSPCPAPEKRLIDLAEWVMRLPSRQPRTVHVSRTLRKKILTPYESAGVHRITKALAHGRDLRPFLGRRTLAIRDRDRDAKGKPSNHDLFFSAWRLLHFHLRADFTNRGNHVARTRRIMIAYLTDNDAYLLDVAAHGKGNADVWGKECFLETLAQDWPDIFTPLEIKGVVGANREGPLEPMQHIQLREAGLTTFIQLNGRVYAAPGLGIATDRTPIAAVQTAARIQRELASIEEQFQNQFPDTDATLFVNNDASVGFFDPGKNAAYSYLSGRTKDSLTSKFFHRLLEESGILAGTAEETIWVPPGTS
ncbi:hypothetical protein [Castellaniella sp.]|uniref:hypothetical protein n=1 Tax=Castellaniella sp. TaxID=1955812 RepID=UPI002AFE5DE2|nr:hypothetical protein [Castellaniella sp.]